jgi:hypothetical protein
LHERRDFCDPGDRIHVPVLAVELTPPSADRPQVILVNDALAVLVPFHRGDPRTIEQRYGEIGNLDIADDAQEAHRLAHDQ